MSAREVPAGLPLHVEVHGEGLPILLVHGYGANRGSFRAWVPELSRSHRVILVDLKGFGSAPKPDDGRYSPVDLAQPIVDLVLGSDLTDVTLLGHSLGGAIILLAALHLLDAGEMGRIRALISVAGTAYPQRLPPFALVARRPLLFQGILAASPKRWLIRHVLRSVVYNPERIDSEQVEWYSRPLRSADARKALVTSARQLVPPDPERFTSRFWELEVPTLLVWGRQDPVVPLALGERLRSDLPRARLDILERCGHLPAEERPVESLRLVQSFLAGLPA